MANCSSVPQCFWHPQLANFDSFFRSRVHLLAWTSPTLITKGCPFFPWTIKSLYCRLPTEHTVPYCSCTRPTRALKERVLLNSSEQIIVARYVTTYISCHSNRHHTPERDFLCGDAFKTCENSFSKMSCFAHTEYCANLPNL